VALIGRQWIALLAATLVLGCRAGDDASQSTDAASSISIGSPYPDAAEVRLFIHASYGDDGRPILKSSDGRTLTAEERSAFENALRIEPKPDSFAACFIPHHFFAYFDGQGRKIGEIAVCFCCEGVSHEPEISHPIGSDDMLGADYRALKALVQEMGEPTDIEC
jgi:hypothetical protein